MRAIGYAGEEDDWDPRARCKVLFCGVDSQNVRMRPRLSSRIHSHALLLLLPVGLLLGCTEKADPPLPLEELLSCSEAIFRPTPAGATLHWIAKHPLDARVSWGHRADDLEHSRVVQSLGPTEFVLDSLAPAREAYYRLEVRPAGEGEYRARPVRPFQTGRRPEESFRVGLIADSHLHVLNRTEGARVNMESTIRRCLEDDLDFVIFLGDEAGVHFYGDTAATIDQEKARARWQFWRLCYAPLLEAIPSFVVIGNHEGEAGFCERLLINGAPLYLQRWGTNARKQYVLNPLPTTYPEGGENAGWTERPLPGAPPTATSLNRSPLQNYFAWTWGSALFVVLDVHRYTVGRSAGGGKTVSGQEVDIRVEDWTLGEEQLAWFESTLAASDAPHKFVLAHHVVGGWNFDLTGENPDPKYHYGRGGAKYARRGEQDRITTIMNRHGARFFLYGHDHVFSHQAAEGIEFVCCGRPTFLHHMWWNTPGWKEAYGQWENREASSFLATIGYTRLTIEPKSVQLEYVRTAAVPTQTENVAPTADGVVYRWDTSSPSPTVDLVD